MHTTWNDISRNKIATPVNKNRITEHLTKNVYKKID